MFAGRNASSSPPAWKSRGSFGWGRGPTFQGVVPQPTPEDFIRGQLFHEISRSGTETIEQDEGPEVEGPDSRVEVSGDLIPVRGQGARRLGPSANEATLLAQVYPDWFDVNRFKIQQSLDDWQGHSIAGMQVALPSASFEDNDWRRPVRRTLDPLVFLFHESFHAFARSLGRPISLEWVTARLSLDKIERDAEYTFDDSLSDPDKVLEQFLSTNFESQAEIFARPAAISAVLNDGDRETRIMPGDEDLLHRFQAVLDYVKALPKDAGGNELVSPERAKKLPKLAPDIPDF